ncbi:MAG: PfkB family carbohydrate kinase [Anaerotardibacter sp.]
MNSSNSLLFIGSIMIDTICPVEALPKPGQGIVIDGHTMTAGGCGYNAAVSAKHLGASCELFAPLGKGPYSALAKEQLEARGFEAFLADTTQDCGFAICLVTPDGERTMITIPGVERSIKSEWFDSIDTSPFSYVYVCGYEFDGSGGEIICDFLRKNPAMKPVFAPGPVITKLSPYVFCTMKQLGAYWHLNEVEAMDHTKTSTVLEAGRALASEYKSTIVITEGSVGAHLFEYTGEEVAYTLVPSQKITPVDTIGAGDNHVGALMAARAAGKSWVESLALANKVSAAICLTKGSTLTNEQFAALGISL